MFQTIESAILFFICFSGTWLLRERPRARMLLLLAASYAFFLRINAAHPLRHIFPSEFGVLKLVLFSFGLLVLSSSLDFFVGKRIHQEPIERNRRGLLVLSVTFNIGVLAFFKYFDFFASEISAILDIDWRGLHLFFPIGISFYTFQTVSYVVDVYRRKTPPTQRYLTYLLYISFFPQLIMGPIVRAGTLIPQLEQMPRLDADRGSHAVARICIGLIKKLAIADFLRIQIVDPVFSNPDMYSALETLTAVYAYSFQIYADFSGYTDIAIGTAALLGVTLPENFNAPYQAQSLRAFWQRWHITLSSWLKDYLYIPLGGSRSGEGRTYLNLMVTMVLGGLWHGPAVTFLFWGCIHGAALVATHVVRNRERFNRLRPPGSRILATFFTFHVVTIAWIFFRAPSLEQAGAVFEALFSFEGGVQNISPGVLAVLGLAAVTQFAPRRYFEAGLAGFKRLPAPAQAVLVIMAIYLAKVAGSTQASPFIYAKF